MTPRDFGPGRGEGQQDPVPEGHVGRGGPGLSSPRLSDRGTGIDRSVRAEPPIWARSTFSTRGSRPRRRVRRFGHPHLHPVPLAVIEGEREDPVVPGERPVESRRGIDSAGKQDDAGFHGL